MPDSTPRFPFGYHLTLLRGDDGTPFHDPAEQERVWGRAWGAHDEVGRLRTVLVRRPGREYERIDGGAWNEDAGALVDPDGMWYWESREPPVIERVREQHDGLIAALRAEEIEVVELAGQAPDHLTSPIYTRDPLLTVPGGAIVGRLEPAKRRGEELLVTRTLASLGMPIIGTIIGTGLLEGGSFVKLTPTVAAYGTSYRCTPRARSSSPGSCGRSASSSWSCRSPPTRSISTATSGSSTWTAP